ncbi:MAG TPA: ABC transporter permease [Syntrophales bacterium]|mgnify:CR=1 FL=1|jgi:ABC-2 type transport system permease protein|nr:ABC transporter permease [Syntrophales bacterium]HON22502.1 ABC transporter permease [Syntrophales bacterium]HOU78444.1 ABC transporter permease [Syntrophales bacterium]HPC32128.1 ABC transporter permease [Syntrophales bacterium]HQG33705.1 ABC transporter permease [Syntrophales bacterium]
MQLRKIGAITRKEFYHLIRDYRSLYLAFAIPLILILLFGYALSLDVDNIRTVVVDYDRTPQSRELIRRLDASPYFHVTARPETSREATGWLDHGRAILAVIIPPDWTKNIQADREASLQILLDGSDPNFANISAGYITAFLERENTAALQRFLDRQGRERMQPPLEGRIRIWFNEDLESRNFIIPGIIAVIIMIVGAMLTSLVIAREYENGTMETIKSLPVSAGEFIVGKAIPYFFITLADVLLAVLMGQVLFGIVMKANFWLMITACSLYLAVAVSLGLFISAAVKSQLVANQIAPLVTFLPSMLLSDFVFPVLNMPPAIQMLTYIVPARYFIDILKGIYMKDLGLTYLWPSFLVLFCMAVLLAALNIVVLKREGM